MADDLREFGSYEQMLAVHSAEASVFWSQRVSMSKLVRQRAQDIGVSVEAFRGYDKSRHVTNARFPIWEILHDSAYSLNDIGKYFGGRHHTTILHGIRRAKEIRKREERLKCNN